MVIKADGRDGVFIIDAIGDGFDKGGLSCVLETHDCYL